MNNSFRTQLLATTLLIAVAAPAYAQDTAATAPAADAPAADSGDTIVVTGSRIARPDLVASSPVAVLSGEAFKTQNAVTVEQLLNVNPQFVPTQGASSNNTGSGDGSATADLRGLGSNRTLVLIDGKRAPSYDVTGSVDLNAIPTALIKRVEVLTGGASAVYGSDAVAGVVNFILDDRFAGLRLDASSQITERGDGATRDVNLTGGVELGSRGNLVVSGGYSKRDGIKFSARPRLATSLDSGDLTQASGSSNTTPTVFGIPGAGRQQVLDAAGNLNSSVYQLYNTNPTNYVFTPLERYNGIAMGRYEITSGIELYGRASYEHIKTDTTLAPTATAGLTFAINPQNPFLSPAERNAFFNVVANPGLQFDANGNSLIGIRRRITETGARFEHHTTETYQFVGGLRGSLTSDLSFDLFAQYGHVKKHEVLENDISTTALQQALLVTPGGACTNPANGCVPVNFFTTTPITPASLGFFIKNAIQDNTIEQFVAGGSVSGDLSFLKSPLADGPAAISVGVEYRKEKGRQRVDPVYASGDLIYYGQGQNADGQYTVKEVYGELKLPLVQDRPFVHALNLETGARYSDYSTVGSVYSYKVGGDWSPVDGVRFRSIYQRAVRAPNLYELFSTRAAATGNLNTDPCAGSAVTASSATGQACVAQIVAGQIAAGGTANIPRAQSIIGTIPTPILGQINVFVVGNRNLQAEKSDTFTAGVVINPARFRAFSLSVDYYNVRIANAIDTATAGSVIANCFGGTINPASAACSSIVRNSLDGSLSGDIIYGVPQAYANLNKIATKGIDVTASYHGGNSEGFNYSLSFAGTYLLKFTKAGDKCDGLFGDICGYDPLPKWKHVVDVTFGFGGVTASTRWRYIGAIHGDADMTGIQVDRLKPYTYIDETVSFDIARKYTLRLGVSNLFDKDPPIIGDTSGAIGNLGNTFPDVYDILGRTFFASVSAKF